MEPRIYVYKITFSGRPEWYYGVHKERKYDEFYMGSPVTHKKFWVEHTPNKEILETFEYSEKGWLEARKREQELILPDLNNPLCLNEACGTGNSLASRSSNMSRLNKEWWTDPVYQEKKKEDVRKQWENDEFREKVSQVISQRNKEHWNDPQRRETLCEISSNRLKATWQERGDQMRENVLKSLKERWNDPSYRARQTEIQTSLIWITDGTKEGTFRVHESQPIPEGYRRGRTLGKVGITDGTKEGNKMILESDPIPEGYWRGRTLR